MADYKTLDGLDLDIGGFTESITRSKQTLEEVSRKGRGIGAKPETEEPESEGGFLAGIAEAIKLFRENGYEPIQPSEDSTTTPKDKVLDEYAELMKSEIIQDAMKEVSTLGESPNKLEDIYTSMDTDFVTLENQPTVDSEGELLEIGQTKPLGLMSKVSPVVTTDKPIMAETPTQPDLKADVDSEILSPTFLNAIGITASLTEKGVQAEVKKILKEQGMSDEEIASIVNKSLAALEVQPTDIPEAYKNVDFDFIKEQEGFKTTAYVPRDEDGKTALENSGVTIASGFDLGMRTEESLKGLPKPIIKKLKPYLGLRRQDAIDYIETPGNELTISENEANIINAFAKKTQLDNVVKAWNATSDVKWKDLSEAKATVVASIAFQFGSDLEAATPKFWRYTTTGDWAAAIAELRDFYEKDEVGKKRQRIYGPRRNREAAYLEQDNL